jgi:hypothetical protein
MAEGTSVPEEGLHLFKQNSCEMESSRGKHRAHNSFAIRILPLTPLGSGFCSRTKHLREANKAT